MNSSKISKNKMNLHNNSNNAKNEKIIINSITDLLKIPIHKLNNSNLENFSGKYFDKIYQEAINSENKLEIDEPSSSNNNPINQTKPKKRNTKEKKIKNNNEKLAQKNIRKKKVHLNADETNSDIVDKKDFYAEELEMGLPEALKLEYSEDIKYIQNSQNNNNINLKISQKNKNVKEKNSKLNHKIINKNSQINYQQKYNINNVTPYSDDKQDDMYEHQSETTPGHDYENNDFYNKKNIYMTTTPTPKPKEKENKNKIFVCPLNKIIFSIVYNSIYGEEVGILGSIPKLGQWKLNEALHLKWNSGNVWKGEIKIGVEDLKDFEFKFVIIEKGKIKYWESGDNNIFNFTDLINEFQFNKKGKYNKYEYEYNSNEGNLLIKCSWKK